MDEREPAPRNGNSRMSIDPNVQKSIHAAATLRDRLSPEDDEGREALAHLLRHLAEMYRAVPKARADAFLESARIVGSVFR